MPLEYCLINNWNLSAIFQGATLSQNEPIKVILFQKQANQSICNYYEQFFGWKQCKLCLFYKAKNILPWHKDSEIIYFIALLYFADYLSKSGVSEQSCLRLTLCNMIFMISSHSAKLCTERTSWGRLHIVLDVAPQDASVWMSLGRTQDFKLTIIHTNVVCRLWC